MNMNNNWDRLSDLAEELLHKRRFIFKGGEPPSDVSFCPLITIYTILITIDSFVRMDDLLTFLLSRRSNRIFLRILRAELFSKQVHYSARLRLQLLQ
jgi:hypothetical protein